MPDPTTATPLAPTPPAGMTAKSEMAEILKIKDRSERDMHKLGGHYNNIVDYKLAEAAGFKSAREFLTAELKDDSGLSQPNLTRYGAVAKNFTEDETALFGVGKLELYIVYRKSAGAEGLRPGDARIAVPDKAGGTSVMPLGQCTANDLRAALRLKRTPQQLPEDVAKAVDKLQAALVAVLGADHPAAAVKGRTKGTEGVIDIDGVPLDHLPAVLEALQKA